MENSLKIMFRVIATIPDQLTMSFVVERYELKPCSYLAFFPSLNDLASYKNTESTTLDCNTLFHSYVRIDLVAYKTSFILKH